MSGDLASYNPSLFVYERGPGPVSLGALEHWFPALMEFRGYLRGLTIRERVACLERTQWTIPTEAGDYRVTGRMRHRRLRECRYWWLIRCATPADGRELIALCERHIAVASGLGRVLAEGPGVDGPLNA